MGAFKRGIKMDLNIKINHDATDEISCFFVSEFDGLEIKAVIDKHIRTSAKKSKTHIMEDILFELSKKLTNPTLNHLALIFYKIAESFTIIQHRQEDSALEEVALRLFLRRYAESQSKITFVDKSALDKIKGGD
jgi:hypothetical protein